MDLIAQIYIISHKNRAQISEGNQNIKKDLINIFIKIDHTPPTPPSAA